MTDAGALILGVLGSFLIELVAILSYFRYTENKLTEGELKILLGVIAGGVSIVALFGAISFLLGALR